MLNTGKLAGRTILITGASRGIGKAIALKCARDGANIVIVAKTAEPHPKLPGTIHTAAQEIEQAGGKALACAVDIRNESAVQDAVERTVKLFGGIDIVVNNASAISLTGTSNTTMKTYDLMQNINTRGTFLVSQKALPYLKVGKNPHILNISPPLNMNPIWFKNHVAYTMAKYGMSMCVLGMAAEFSRFGIAVNALWPRTAIATAAMEMLGGGKEIFNQSRKVDIMADAAYVMLTRDSKSYTGIFAIDDEVLTSVGVTNFDEYACAPGHQLLPDFFLDDSNPDYFKPKMKEAGDSSKLSPEKSEGSLSTTPDDVFPALGSLITPEIISDMNGVFYFELKGLHPGDWYLDLQSEGGAWGKGKPPMEAGCTMKMESEDFVAMAKGDLKPTKAFFTGKLTIDGDMFLAMKLEKVLKTVAQTSKL